MKSSIPFRISGLPADPFLPLFRLTDSELSARGARRCICDSRPGFPCRVSLEEANVGETVILLPFPHHSVQGPYQGVGPIYVREGALEANLQIEEVPDVVRNRLMSVRAYDAEGLMIASEIVQGHDIEKQIETFFADDTMAYLHLHNGKPGCYSCRVDRVG